MRIDIIFNAVLFDEFYCVAGSQRPVCADQWRRYIKYGPQASHCISQGEAEGGSQLCDDDGDEESATNYGTTI